MKTRFLLLFILLYSIFFLRAEILTFNRIISYDSFVFPSAVAVSDNYIYISDQKERAVFRFDSEGNFQMKFGVNQLKMPVDVEIDGFDFVYVLDSHNGNVLKFDSRGTFIDIMAQNLYQPSSLDRDSRGRFIISDYGNSQVKIYSDSWKLVETIKCITPDGKEFSPSASFLTDNRVYIADWSSSSIYLFNIKGTFIKEFKNDEADFYKIEGIQKDSLDRKYILDWGNSSVKIFDNSANLIEKKGGYGFEKNRLNFPSDFKIFKNKLYICDSLNNRIVIYNVSTHPLYEFKVDKIEVPFFPLLDIYFETSFDDFRGENLEIFLNDNKIEIKEQNNPEKKVRIEFPENLANRLVDFSSFYNYNENLKLRFDKKIRVDKE
ncbi:MAG: NHL repeat-containing protein [Candidatus Muiribacteriota bacterium]